VTFHRPSMRRDNCELSTTLFPLHPTLRALANLSAPRSRVTKSRAIVWIRWLWKLKSFTVQIRTFPACHSLAKTTRRVKIIKTGSES
jgi:hypothetical protein